jgi:membrane protein implicated in regulation of membrane protease activity
MQRFATVPVILVLALFAAWIGYGATRVAIIAESRDTGFWVSIAVLYVFAAAAAWFAFRLYRIRQSKRRQPLTNG